MTLPEDIAIELNNVFERYDIEIIIDGKPVRESFLALQDITFTVKKGESIAVVGPNGSGKSTLLRLIAGLLKPEKGEVKVNGRVGSLLDLTAGFHPELTGRDNLLLNASLYNFSRDEFNLKYEQILQFADIGKFINVPVRCYSQGMYVRLAFSLAIHVDPDILLIDDCLAVGDDNFRMKSIDKALELKSQNKTIIFVTHDFGLARQLCARGIYLKESKIIKDSDVEAALSCYLQPSVVGKGVYKYIEARAQEEEEKRILEEKRRILELERRKQGETLYCGSDLKLVIAPGKVKLFYNEKELTANYGLQTLFNLYGNDVGSSSANWKIRKMSEKKVVCFIKWPKPRSIFQVWTWQILKDEVVEWEVLSQSRDHPHIENERVELFLRVSGGVLNKNILGNKSRVIICGEGPGLRFETLRDDQISGVATDEEGLLRPYFLTVNYRQGAATQSGRVRWKYFSGRFYTSAVDMPSDSIIQEPCRLSSGRTSLEFKEGICRIYNNDIELTTGLGAYTSLYSKGIWYDSKQALWQVTYKDMVNRNIRVEGTWPWLPVSQIWEITKKDENNITFRFVMKVLKRIRIDMQETVIMLSNNYDKWSTGPEKKNFLEEYTCDDLFRLCLWAARADGGTAVSLHSDNLPTVIFSPKAMDKHRIIVENAAHIEGGPSRVLHCLRSNKDGQTYFDPGEYEFFEGLVNVKEG